MKTLRHAVRVGVVAWCLSLPAFAGNPAQAERLFQQGLKAAEQGKYAEAAEFFTGSHREDPSAGTLLNLAKCHAALNRTASAWEEYRAAARLAHEQGRLAERPEETEARFAQEREADQAAKELESKLSLMVLRLDAPIVGLRVLINNAPLDLKKLNTLIPLDPGAYEVVATATGYQPQKAQLNLSQPGQQELRLALIPDPVQPGAGPAPTPQLPLDRTPASNGQRNTAYWVGGGGLAFLAAGGVFGVLALNENSTMQKICTPGTIESCPEGKHPEAQQHDGPRNTYAVLADVGLGAGIVALGVASYLYFTSKTEAPNQWGVTADLRPDQASMAVTGRF